MLNLGPTHGSLGGGPELSVSSPDDVDEILQHEEQERKRVTKQLAEDANQAQLIIEERKCTVPKSRAAVDYTLTGIEPHGPSRSV